MRIAIIGGGFTGLTAAYELSKRGHRVTVFEKEKVLGGLAHGFRRPSWGWHLEQAYHHLFANDRAILRLIKELGLEDKLLLTRPITANLIDEMSRTSDTSEGLPATRISRTNATKDKGKFPEGTSAVRRQDKSSFEVGEGGGGGVAGIREWQHPHKETIVQLDSPIHLFTYPGLTAMDKLRTAALLAFCKLYPDQIGGYPFWQPLEGITAKQLFECVGGKKAWQALWEPLMVGKFGDLADTIAASWLWARIKKRTPNLYYIKGGFHTVIEALVKSIKQYGSIIQTSVSISSITQPNNKKICFCVSGRKSNNKSFSKSSFDAILLTVPTPIAEKLLSHLSLVTCHLSPSPIPHLHAQTLILETKEPILASKGVAFKGSPCVYWLNITDRSFPFLAVVAHTNMVDKKYYANHHITYFGNYLPEGHPYLSMTKKQLLKVFLPYIKRLSQNSEFRVQNIESKIPNSKFQILNSNVFVGPYAQPVHQLHYSKRAPHLETSVKGVYLANLDSIYPWDRGTNYAVELGKRAATAITQSDQ